MKMYRVVAPQGEITIGMQYGSLTFKNGQEMPESAMVKLYPQYFLPIEKVKTPVVAPEVLVEAEIAEAPVVPEAPVKRKAGRPKKIK